MNHKASVFGAAISALLTTSLLAQPAAPSNVTIESISNAGNGCYPGSVAKNISDDGRAMTLLFDDFIVEAGPEVGPQQSKSCNVKLGMKVPAGWSYSLFCVDFRGYADLDRNVKAAQSAQYTFDGSRHAKVGSMELVGPKALDYTHLTQIPVNSLSWSPCSTGEVKPLSINTKINIALPPPVALDHRVGRKKADDIDDGATAIRSRVRRYERSLEPTVRKLSDLAEDLEDLFKDRKPISGLLPKFNEIRPLVKVVGERIAANAALRDDRRVQKYWQEVKDAKKALVAMLMPAPNGAGGLMTVDSIDGNLSHHYGITWKRCNPNEPLLGGKWVQGDGRKRCDRVCAEKGLSLGRSPEGAQCVSGEARPLSAQGKIQFKYGCWSDCSTQGAVKTDVVGRMCYRPGQKRDHDRTDRAVGCFCQ